MSHTDMSRTNIPITFGPLELSSVKPRPLMLMTVRTMIKDIDEIHLKTGDARRELISTGGQVMFVSHGHVAMLTNLSRICTAV